MKIAVEFVRAGQEWDPNTGRSSNYLLLSFGGKQFRVECTETEMGDFITQAAGGAAVPEPEYAGPGDESFAFGEYGEDLDDEPVDEVLYDRDAAPRTEGGDFVFGGDLPEDTPVASPVLFDVGALPDNSETRPAPPLGSMQQRKANIETRLEQRPIKLRKQRQDALRAKARQIPRRKHDADEAGNPVVPAQSMPMRHPEHAPEATQSGGDDDLFAQG